MQDLLNTNVSSEYEDELNDALSRHEVDVNVALENLSNLCKIHNKIVDTKGINCNLAITVESLVENTLDTTKYPINSYTKDLSMTNYTVTLESIVSSIGKVITAIWNAIKKFFLYIWNIIFSIFGMGKKQQMAIEKLETEIVEVKKDTILLLEHVPEASKAEFKSLESDNDIQFEIDKLGSKLLTEICKHSTIAQAITEASVFFKDFVKETKDRISFVTNITKELSNLTLEKEAIVIEKINSNTNHNYVKAERFITTMQKVVSEWHSTINGQDAHVESNSAITNAALLSTRLSALSVLSNKLIEDRLDKAPPLSTIKSSILGNYEVAGFNILGMEGEVEEFTAEIRKIANTSVTVDKIEFENLSKVYRSLCILSRREVTACEQFMSLSYRLICLRRKLLEAELASSKRLHKLIEQKFKTKGFKIKR